MKIIFILFLILTASTTTATVYALPTNILKHNTKDICKAGNNARNLTEILYVCIDSKTKKKYLGTPEPIVTTSVIANDIGGKKPTLMVGQYTNDSKQNILSDNLNTNNFLVFVQMSQLCMVAGDLSCVKNQSSFVTENLTTTKNSNGDWNIKGFVKNIDPDFKNNIKVQALFYDRMGVEIGGYVGGDISSIMGNGGIGSFDLKTVKTPNVKPVFISLIYH